MRRMACPTTGKIIFWNEETAAGEVVRLICKGYNMRAYRCNACKNFHLATRKNRSGSKQKREIPP